MEECGVCYEEKRLKHLPCSHSLCNECYSKLLSDHCPYCRRRFRISDKERYLLYPDFNDPHRYPEHWLTYPEDNWIVYSRYLRSGREIIEVFRRDEVPDSWRNDSLTTIIRRNRQRRKFRRNMNRRV